MKILQINLTYKTGSTGRIVSDIDKIIQRRGYESYILCGYGDEVSNHKIKCIYSKHILLYMKKNIFISRISGKMGYTNKFKTKKALKWIDEIKPDLIHLHNIHGNWINVFNLIDYIEKNKIPVIWTLHDCWSFTGRCSHFENLNCEKWKTGCYTCMNRKIYPITYFFDFSKSMWKDKKKLFPAIENLTIVTPSNWLLKYVTQSYFKSFNSLVIHNGIDLDTFYPRKHRSIYYEKINSKKIILGVAASWTENKGLYDFYSINKKINKKKYQIVLVGLNERQIREAPKDIIVIGRTKDSSELAELYSGANVFVNTTYLDNYPTVNLEAIACGTPVITYETGGSIESINIDTGRIVPQGNIEKMIESIEFICKDKSKYFDSCLSFANKNFSKELMANLYLNLYNEKLK